MLACGLLTSCFRLDSEPPAPPGDGESCDWQDSLTIFDLQEPFEYVAERYSASTSMGGSAAQEPAFEPSKLWFDPAELHEPSITRRYERSDGVTGLRSSRVSTAEQSSGKLLVEWYAPRQDGALPEDNLAAELSLELLEDRSANLGLDPLDDQDMEDLAFIFYTPHFGFVQSREFDSDVSSLDGAQERLEVWVFGVAAEDVGEELSVEIMDASALSTPRRADDEEALAPLYRELISRQRAAGTPFAIAAYCAYSFSFSCMDSRSVEFAAAGEVRLQGRRSWVYDDGERSTVDAEVTVKVGAFASLESEASCLPFPEVEQRDQSKQY